MLSFFSCALFSSISWTFLPIHIPLWHSLLSPASSSPLVLFPSFLVSLLVPFPLFMPAALYASIFYWLIFVFFQNAHSPLPHPPFSAASSFPLFLPFYFPRFRHFLFFPFHFSHFKRFLFSPHLSSNLSIPQHTCEICTCVCIAPGKVHFTCLHLINMHTFLHLSLSFSFPRLSVLPFFFFHGSPFVS